MIASWIRPVEQIVSAMATSGARVIGLLGVNDGVGVTTLAGMTCDVIVSGGTPALLVDLAEPVSAATVMLESEETGIWQRSTGASQACPVVTAHITDENRFQLNNLAWLRQNWNNELAAFGFLVVDMPPVLSRRIDRVNPLAIAASCDTVFLLCQSDQTARYELVKAVDMLRTVNVGLAGLILNAKAAT